MCNMERISLTVSEEMSFENVDRRMDGCRMPLYTISSPMSEGSGELMILQDIKKTKGSIQKPIRITKGNNSNSIGP